MPVWRSGMNDVLSRGIAFVGLGRGGIAIPAGTAFDPKETSDVRTTTAAVLPIADFANVVTSVTALAHGSLAWEDDPELSDLGSRRASTRDVAVSSDSRSENFA